MSRTLATPAGSSSITEKVRVTVDWKAEPTDWDHAVARFLLAIVHKKSLPATVAPLAETSGDILYVAAGSPPLASPTGWRSHSTDVAFASPSDSNGRIVGVPDAQSGYRFL